MRGPGVVPRVPGRPQGRSERERFDAIVLAVARDLEERWREHLGLVEYAVEDTPQLPEHDAEVVPLASLVRGTGSRPSRIVVFRRPIEHRAETRGELEQLVLLVVVDQVAELLGIDPTEVDPRVADDDED